MNKQILEKLNDIHYFTIESYMQIVDMDEIEKPKARNCLYRAAKAGQIIRVKKGVYITRDFHDKYHQDERFLPIISQIINPLSYVSSTYILQKHNLLTEATYINTAITQKNTSEVINDIGHFTYQYIKQSLYKGFSSHDFLGFIYHTATIAKALFDYLYLRPIPRALRVKGISIADELRLNLELINSKDKMEFFDYVRDSGSEKMTMIYENFEVYSWQL